MSKPTVPQKQPSNPQAPQFPSCKNKKQAKLVCLNPSCQQHAFFCTSCQNDECQVVHHHGNKLLSVSFNEYVKKVLRERKLDPSLEEAIVGYTECLEKLKKDVLEFVQKEINQLEEIKRKALQFGDQQEKIIKRLRNKEYQDLKGSQLDKLWQRMAETDSKNNTKDTVEFLTIKKEQIIQISDNFEKVNKMQLEDYMDEENENEQSKQKISIKDKEKEKEGQSSKLSKNQPQGALAKKEEPPVSNNSSKMAKKK